MVGDGGLSFACRMTIPWNTAIARRVQLSIVSTDDARQNGVENRSMSTGRAKKGIEKKNKHEGENEKEREIAVCSFVSMTCSLSKPALS